jgi:hypothetical protein
VTPLDDNLLDALRAARPVSTDETATSREAMTMLGTILEQPAVVAPDRRPRRRWAIAVPIGVAAAAAVAATVMVGQSGSHHPSTAVAAKPAPVDLRTAILTAIDSTADQIQHSHETLTMPGEPRMVTDGWTYPAVAKPGDQLRQRRRIDQDGAGYQDVEMIYTVPKSTNVTVSKGVKSWVTGRLIDVEYPTRTWSDQKRTSLVAPPDDRGPAQIKQQIASGHFKVDGRVMLDGRPSIELSWTPDAGSLSQLWVDARTYQLVKTVFHDSVGTPGKMTHGTYVTTFTMLAATTTNLASLSPTIPSGFTRTATPPSHPHG